MKRFARMYWLLTILALAASACEPAGTATPPATEASPAQKDLLLIEFFAGT